VNIEKGGTLQEKTKELFQRMGIPFQIQIPLRNYHYTTKHPFSNQERKEKKKIQRFI
jgi:hypothetical protein